MKIILGSIAINEVCVFIPDTHPSYQHWHEFCIDSFIDIVSDIENLRTKRGDFLFLVSCTEIIKNDIRSKFKNCIVIHESDLPKGRGWSPMAWQILEGRSDITVSAIRCADPVDSGDIIKQAVLHLDGTELYDEIHRKAFVVKSGLVMELVAKNTDICDELPAVKQVGEPTFYKRRRPEDSELDTHKSIAEQFDLLRICEPRFPAFIHYRGCKYEISMKKVSDDRKI
jgi:methionyl-tRNA formyltransferase